MVWSLPSHWLWPVLFSALFFVRHPHWPYYYSIIGHILANRCLYGHLLWYHLGVPVLMFLLAELPLSSESPQPIIFLNYIIPLCFLFVLIFSVYHGWELFCADFDFLASFWNEQSTCLSCAFICLGLRI